MFKKKLQIVTASCAKTTSYKKQETTSGFWESLKGYITNIAYGIDGIKTYATLNADHSYPSTSNQRLPLFLMGKSYESLQDCKKAHQQIVWFTYRKNYRIRLGLHSDVGWGCMIRVAQMCMAAALSLHFKLSNKKIEQNYIITAFLQEESLNIKYSLNKFVQKGRTMWSINAGQWYSMTQITTILQALHQQTPLRGSENLKIKVFNETINVQDIIYALESLPCKCYQNKQRIYCPQCHSTSTTSLFIKKQSVHCRNYIKKSANNQNNQKHILLMITTQLGSNQVSQSSYSGLLQLMQLTMFCGCLGGVPRKARFLTGICGDKISYLDPHYVEETVDRIELQKKIDSFYCKDYRLMNRQDLDPQITICFYIKNLEDLQVLINTLDEIREGLGERFIGYQRLAVNAQCEETNLRRLKLKQHFQDLEDCASERSSSMMSSSFIMD